MDQDKDGNSGQVVARAAAVLRALENQPQGVTLAVLARATDLPRSTVQRLVAALQAQQMAAVADGRITLGPAILRLAGAAFVDVVSVARPHVEALGRATLETVNLSVLRGNHAILVDQVASERELRVVTPVGTALPLYCTAHGKALLAAMDDAEIERRLAGTWERRTERTVATLPALLADLGGVRGAGIAMDVGENIHGVCGVGITLDTRTPERYALSIVMPAVRFEGSRDAICAAMRDGACAIAACFS
ncbi:MAG: IclR family transcriptional regulator [Azospirillaceae bacterium]|nr:IclR family transcriptional regulator [Azospirillaceae bacterium]